MVVRDVEILLGHICADPQLNNTGNVIVCLSWPLEQRSSVISENVDCTLLAIFSYRSTTPTGQLLHTGKFSIEHL